MLLHTSEDEKQVVDECSGDNSSLLKSRETQNRLNGRLRLLRSMSNVTNEILLTPGGERSQLKDIHGQLIMCWP